MNTINLFESNTVRTAMGKNAEPHFLGSYHLFTRPSFLSGMARVLDLGATLQYYNYSASEEAADAVELYTDWFMVGRDIERAIQTVKAELKDHDRRVGARFD